MRIGIDLGGTKTEGVILGPGGEEISRRRYPSPQTEGYEAILNTIGSMVAELEHMAGRQCTVGVCTPGAVSQLNGCLKNSNTVCMNGRPVARDLETLLDRPVRLENDANCFALAEAIDGAGKNAGSVFGIILGTGVGAGIVINRTLIKGLHHIAGEWGHNVLEVDGPQCYCGNHGCVETFLSGPGLAAEYVRQGGGHRRGRRYGSRTIRTRPYSQGSTGCVLRSIWSGPGNGDQYSGPRSGRSWGRPFQYRTPVHRGAPAHRTLCIQRRLPYTDRVE